MEIKIKPQARNKPKWPKIDMLIRNLPLTERGLYFTGKRIILNRWMGGIIPPDLKACDAKARLPGGRRYAPLSRKPCARRFAWRWVLYYAQPF